VRREGKTWTHPWLTLNAARNRTGRTRCGFVVGKQLGKAHDRNRAKRRTREAVRLAYAGIAPGWDLVFIIRLPVLDVPFAALERAVHDLLRRAGLWAPLEGAHVTPDATPTHTNDHPPVPTPLASDPA